jgi:hypothetical protein
VFFEAGGGGGFDGKREGIGEGGGSGQEEESKGEFEGHENSDG